MSFTVKNNLTGDYKWLNTIKLILKDIDSKIGSEKALEQYKSTQDKYEVPLKKAKDLMYITTSNGLPYVVSYLKFELEKKCIYKVYADYKGGNGPVLLEKLIYQTKIYSL